MKNMKWLGTDMLFVYGVVANFLYMFEALTGLLWLIGPLGVVPGLVGLVMLIRDAVKHKSTPKNWVLFAAFVLVYWLSTNVVIG